jgi:hypothetical protein
MFDALRTLFAPKPIVLAPAEPEPGDGKVTLADVLRRDWLELWLAQDRSAHAPTGRR